jgi:hypothetical protein
MPAALSLALLVPAGCGGGSDDNAAPPPDTRKPPRSAEIPPHPLGSSDRRAYRAIQAASGVLRAAAVPVAFGATTRIETSRLRRAARRVSATDPSNGSLQKLRTTTQDALTALAAPSGDPKAKGKAAMTEADRIDDGLRRYAASHPAANEIAPG